MNRYISPPGGVYSRMVSMSSWNCAVGLRALRSVSERRYQKGGSVKSGDLGAAVGSESGKVKALFASGFEGNSRGTPGQ